jgi:LPS export ABC transporter protein LptC
MRYTLFISLILLFFACGNDNTIVIDPSEAKQSMKNANIVYTDSGNLQMVTFGKEMIVLDDSLETQIFPQGVQSTFYNEDGSPGCIITADSAANSRKEELMHLMKNVVIKNFNEKHTSYTEDFYWDQKKRNLYSNVYILQVYDNGNRFEGTGFTANEDMSEFTLKKASAVMSY